MTHARSNRPRAAYAVSAIVLAAVLAGTAGALPGRNTVDRDDVRPNTIGSKHIRDGQVKAADLARPERWRVVGKPGGPQFSDGGEGDCVWTSNGSSGFAPASFRKDPFGRVQLRGVAFASDGAGGDGRCDWSQPGETEDGIVFLLPRGYRPAYVTLSAVAYQLAAVPAHGAVFGTDSIPGGAVYSAGPTAVFDDAEFDAARAGSAERRAPADLSLLIPLGPR